jgi:phospholipase C
MPESDQTPGSPDQGTHSHDPNSADATDTESLATPPDDGPSRRAFLKTAGFTAAGVAAGGIAGGAIGAGIGESLGQKSGTDALERQLQQLPERSGAGFDHLIVLMFENRSFDNLIGRLYDKDNLPKGQKFDGLNFGDYSNPDPLTGDRIPSHIYQGGTDYVMSQPDPDPGEAYPHVNTQLFGTVDPPENANLRLRFMTAPFNAPPKGAKPTMEGFVADYINNFRADHGTDPEPNQYRKIMGGFSPEMLPVTSALARNFAVYDHWHCAVPTQTFANRSFFHAGTSHGYVTNAIDGGFEKWLDPNLNSTTIFNRLEEAGIKWRVYYDDRQLISMTGFIHAPVLKKFWHSNFRTMSEFYDDVKTGNLPAYSFIEPRMIYDHNDMHPPVGPQTATDVNGQVITGGAISDVRAGEALLHNVYTAVKNSAATSGSNAMNTMLLVTFDEHGGTYDHVPPPSAVPPKNQPPSPMGFTFDRLGLRVPAIAISAYTAAGSVINDPMHHGSVASTLMKKYRLKPLTARDEHAPTIDNAVNLTKPRQPSSWPETHPQWVPPNPESSDPVPAGDDDRPLSPPGVGLVGMLTAFTGANESTIPKTYREAFTLIDQKGKGLFGRR